MRETNGKTALMPLYADLYLDQIDLLVYKTLTPRGVVDALAGVTFDRPNFTGRIILPGLAESLTALVAEFLGRPIESGPICAAELPLFFGADWAR